MAKLKAAAYVRVSTSSKAQEHSFEFQDAYWRKEIEEKPQYDFAGIYADQGISGKSAKRRPQFQALIRDARAGEIDIILTKSVQRFARNTTELLTVVRELRDKGVAVYFEKENINTLQPTSEIYLTVAAAVAENDLNVYAENQKWAIRDKFKKGEMQNGLYGYVLTKDKTLIQNNEQAKVIKEIYEEYLAGQNMVRIAKLLTDKGIPTPTGKSVWSDGVIKSILTNEKYMGDCLLQKTIHENGQTRLNKGEAPQYYIENSHRGIISREVFEEIQRQLDERGNQKLRGREKTEYPFTSLIECGICGKKYSHKINNSGTAWAKPIWSCATYLDKGRAACDGTSIRDDSLKEKFVETYNEFIEKQYKGIDENELKKAQDKLLEEERELTALKTKGRISVAAYDKEHYELMQELKTLQFKLRELRQANVSLKDYTKIESFDENKLYKFIKKVIVHKWTVTFEFYNGVQLTKPYENGKPGNLKGWRERQKGRSKQ